MAIHSPLIRRIERTANPNVPSTKSGFSLPSTVTWLIKIPRQSTLLKSTFPGADNTWPNMVGQNDKISRTTVWNSVLGSTTNSDCQLNALRCASFASWNLNRLFFVSVFIISTTIEVVLSRIFFNSSRTVGMMRNEANPPRLTRDNDPVKWR